MSDAERQAAEKWLADEIQRQCDFVNSHRAGIAARIAADFAERLAREAWKDGHNMHSCVLDHCFEDDGTPLSWAAACEAMEKEPPK